MCGTTYSPESEVVKRRFICNATVYNRDASLISIFQTGATWKSSGQPLVWERAPSRKLAILVFRIHKLSTASTHQPNLSSRTDKCTWLPAFERWDTVLHDTNTHMFPTPRRLDNHTGNSNRFSVWVGWVIFPTQIILKSRETHEFIALCSPRISTARARDGIRYPAYHQGWPGLPPRPREIERNRVPWSGPGCGVFDIIFIFHFSRSNNKITSQPPREQPRSQMRGQDVKV